MTKTPQHKYDGLVAKWYDRLIASEKNDVAFYCERAGEVDGPILELGCGTGRILVPICGMGKDIEGLDVSSEMLAICRRKLARKGLSAKLHEQDCADFDTGRRYSMIFMSGGSFQLLAAPGEAESCLAHVRSHLSPGGEFLLDVFQIKGDSDGVWRDGRSATWGRQEIRCRSLSRTDTEKQVQTSQWRYELYRDGELAKVQEAELALRWYEGDQLPKELRAAGFSSVEQHPQTIISRHSGTMVYSAWA
jgi:SAM-dependent methyltransferase